MYLSHTIMGVTSRSHTHCHRAVKRVTWSDPDPTALFWTWRRGRGPGFSQPLKQETLQPDHQSLAVPSSAVLHEKVAASSLFSDTVIVVLQWSALIIVYKYCVFMGNC